MDISRLKELNQAIQDNPELPEHIKKAVAAQTLYIDYLNTCVESNTRLSNQVHENINQKDTDYVLMAGERVYPTNSRIPALPIPKHGYIDSTGMIVAPVKN